MKKNEKSIKLTEFQFNLLLPKVESIHNIRENLLSLEANLTDMLALICEHESIDVKKVGINVDIEARELKIKNINE